MTRHVDSHICHNWNSQDVEYSGILYAQLSGTAHEERSGSSHVQLSGTSHGKHGGTLSEHLSGTPHVKHSDTVHEMLSSRTHEESAPVSALEMFPQQTPPPTFIHTHTHTYIRETCFNSCWILADELIRKLMLEKKISYNNWVQPSKVIFS